jgi:hypothetical protein
MRMENQRRPERVRIGSTFRGSRVHAVLSRCCFACRSMCCCFNSSRKVCPNHSTFAIISITKLNLVISSCARPFDPRAHLTASSACTNVSRCTHTRSTDMAGTASIRIPEPFQPGPAWTRPAHGLYWTDLGSDLAARKKILTRARPDCCF